MVSELVADSPEDEMKGGREESSPLRYGKRFEDLCGFYMSIGMSYSDYWDGDCQMTKYYREKYLLDRDRKNFELWLQGMYIYEALLDVYPVLNPLSKNKEPIPYRSEPIALTREGSEKNKERDNLKKLEDGKRAMMSIMDGINKKFKEKGVKDGN